MTGKPYACHTEILTSDIISRINKLAASAIFTIIILISAPVFNKTAIFTLFSISITARGENTAYISFFLINPIISKDRTFGFASSSLA
jgi:hypothetical protein